MISILFQIYILIVGHKSPEVIATNTVLIIFLIQAIIKLNANCLINGLVYDESIVFLSAMDSIDSYETDRDFREAVIFMSMNRDIKCGLTIAGFVPLNKSTLIGV